MQKVEWKMATEYAEVFKNQQSCRQVSKEEISNELSRRNTKRTKELQ